MGEHATRKGSKGVEPGPDEGGRGYVQASVAVVGADTKNATKADREWGVGAVDEGDKWIGAGSYRRRRAMTTKTNYGRVLVMLIALWFVAALTASALHVFAGAPNRPPLELLVAVLAPITIFTVWYFRSKSFRQYILSLNPRTLTLVHTWRLVGFVFLVLGTYKILPEIFALPAGWGDIAIGATALPVAILLTRPEYKTSFIVWQLLGVADLVLAIALGAATRYIDPQGAASISTLPLALLPLSLIPTFAVPLLLILHGISIAQARRWTSEARDLRSGVEGLPAA